VTSPFLIHLSRPSRPPPRPPASYLSSESPDPSLPLHPQGPYSYPDCVSPAFPSSAHPRPSLFPRLLSCSVPQADLPSPPPTARPAGEAAAALPGDRQAVSRPRSLPSPDWVFPSPKTTSVPLDPWSTGQRSYLQSPARLWR
jgi:hypothetical protein